MNIIDMALLGSGSLMSVFNLKGKPSKLLEAYKANLNESGKTFKSISDLEIDLNGFEESFDSSISSSEESSEASSELSCSSSNAEQASEAPLVVDTAMRATIARSVVKKMIPLLTKLDETSYRLTLQQILLVEIYNLSNWPDEEFRKKAIGLLLQVDQENELPLVGYRALNPFAPTNPQHMKYSIIFSLAAHRELMRESLGSLLLEGAYNPQTDQEALDSASLNLLGTLYFNLFNVLTENYELSTKELVPLQSDVLKKLNSKQVRTLLASNEQSLRSSKIILSSDEDLAPTVEKLIVICESTLTITRRCNKSAREDAKKLLSVPNYSNFHMVRISERIDIFLRESLIHFEIICKNCENMTALGKVLMRITKNPVLNGEFEKEKKKNTLPNFCQFLIKEIGESTILKNSGVNMGAGTKQWAVTWSKQAADFAELMENFPFELDEKTIKELLRAQISAMETQSVRYLNKKDRERNKKFHEKNHTGTDSETQRLYNYDIAANKVLDHARRKRRIFNGSIQGLKRQITLLSTRMKESDAQLIPDWILEIDALPKPTTSMQIKHTSRPVAASSSNSPPLAEDEIDSAEDSFQTQLTENTSAVPVDAFLDKFADWHSPISSQDTFSKFSIFPDFAVTLQAAFTPRTTKSLEEQLLQDAKYHLFLLNQGMQILLTAVLHGDHEALTVALPNLVLDHHSLIECYLKSQIAAMTNELSTTHVLETLGRETAQSDTVMPYLMTFNQGTLWERYLYTSKAIMNHTHRESPEALLLIGDVVEGKIDPAKVAAFAIKSYRQLLHFMLQNQFSADVRTVETIESLFTKLDTWCANLQIAPAAVVQKPIRGKGKARAAVVLKSTTTHPAQKVMGIIESLSSIAIWEDSPAIPAKEVVAHYKRLEASKGLLERYKTLELTAYHDRNIQTATYLFEQAYRARALALLESGAPFGHRFTASQNLLDPKRDVLNQKTNSFFVGIARRYPVYFGQKEFIALLKASQLLVGMDAGFKPVGRNGDIAEKRFAQLMPRLEQCQELANTHLSLLADALIQYRSGI